MVLTLAILIDGLVAIFRWYVEPTRRIIDAMMSISSANPSFRINIIFLPSVIHPSQRESLSVPIHIFGDLHA